MANTMQNEHGREGGSHGGEAGPADHGVTIRIDRETYVIGMQQISGQQLRLLPAPPIGSDRDLFQVVPGGSDHKVGDADIIALKSGMRFFTAPAQINPGRES